MLRVEKQNIHIPDKAFILGMSSGISIGVLDSYQEVLINLILDWL